MALMEKLFLGIGAMKAGTTWVYSMLETHPQLHFTPEKEIHLLAHHYSDGQPLTDQHRQNRASTRLSRVKHLRPERQQMMREWYEQRYLQGDVTPIWYESLFTKSDQNARWNCDFSNLSALIPSTGWSKIRSDIANLIKAIYILRNPCERLWSQFKFSNQEAINLNKKEDLNNIKAFLESHEANQHSHYCQNIDAAREGLGFDNVKPLIFDHIKTNPEQLLASIESFLGINNKNHSSHKNLHKQINQTTTNSPPKIFQALCQDITERELNGLKQRQIHFPEHWWAT